jgi:hypothetical protein
LQASRCSSLEQAGRIARRNFFARVRASASPMGIATGHTCSYQAETVSYTSCDATFRDDSAVVLIGRQRRQHGLATSERAQRSDLRAYWADRAF